MKTYRIGREGEGIDIKIQHETVSRKHAELVVSDNGRYYLHDCASTSGTFLNRGGKWKAIRQEFVDENETVFFGKFSVTINELLRRGLQLDSEKDIAMEGKRRRRADDGNVVTAFDRKK